MRIWLIVLSAFVGLVAGQYLTIYVLSRLEAKELFVELEEYLGNINSN